MLSAFPHEPCTQPFYLIYTWQRVQLNKTANYFSLKQHNTKCHSDKYLQKVIIHIFSERSLDLHPPSSHYSEQILFFVKIDTLTLQCLLLVIIHSMIWRWFWKTQSILKTDRFSLVMFPTLIYFGKAWNCLVTHVIFAVFFFFFFNSCNSKPQNSSNWLWSFKCFNADGKVC